MEFADLAGLDGPELLAALQAIDDHRRYNKKEFWKPYPKQSEFIALGAKHKERVLFAGNQLGKSDCGAYEVACHLTGLYPDDWRGFKYTYPNEWWAAGVSTTAVRDIQQAKLCGEPEVEDDYGTGFIPRDCFVGRPTLARGAVSGSYDTARIRHFTNGVEDGVSTLQFKSYEQGRMKFQGKTLKGGVWWDEEPPMDVYVEGNARWSATEGRCLMTFTPLLGFSDVVVNYLDDATGAKAALTFTADECPHMTPEKIAELKAKYPEHEWGARLYGDPFMGSGRVFRVNEEIIKFPVDQMIPPHWALLWGIDFGITHPFAAVLIAWDKETDVVYVLETYRAADELPLVHSEAVRRIAADIPVAWPHDGHRRDPGSGNQLAKLYKALDLKMLQTHAHWPGGGFSTEAAVLEMQQRLQSGRLRVREDLADFFGEYRQYHRKEGLLVKVRDDLLSACMKALMMKRYARAGIGLGWRPRPGPKQPGERRDYALPVDPWTGAPVYPI